MPTVFDLYFWGFHAARHWATFDHPALDAGHIKDFNVLGPQREEFTETHMASREGGVSPFLAAELTRTKVGVSCPDPALWKTGRGVCIEMKFTFISNFCPVALHTTKTVPPATVHL